MTRLERGTDIPRNNHQLADGDYCWPRNGGWVAQSVRGNRIVGAFAPTLTAAAENLFSGGRRVRDDR